MKIQRKIWNYILIFVLGMMGMITIIFFLVEKLLGDGRCYIPQSAIMIALMLCVFWQIALITVACLLGRRIKKIFHGVVKMMMTIVTVSGTLCLVLFLAWNWLIYSFKFDEKVEQYDEHIALYVNNTFVRTRFRYPHYMYEETITLIVDGVWADYNSDCAFTNRIVVQPFEDGTFRYLANSIEQRELELPVIARMNP